MVRKVESELVERLVDETHCKAQRRVVRREKAGLPRSVLGV
jgi:hypothetical protein